LWKAFVVETEPSVVCPAFDWNVPPMVTLPVDDALANVSRSLTSISVLETLPKVVCPMTCKTPAAKRLVDETFVDDTVAAVTYPVRSRLVPEALVKFKVAIVELLE